ncbi:MAG: hypothetical protein KAT09_04220 [Candidatus Aegiribacteria sp.]|nr:hypothetical protein [Candidatus Aegiribacteria sp.]
MRKLIAFLAVISLFTVFGCGSSSTGPSGNDDYLPMAVGNQWNYSLSGYVSTIGSADTTVLSGSNVTQVIGTTTHQQGFELYTIKDSLITIMTTPDTVFTHTTVTMNYAHNTDSEWRMYDDTTSTDYELFMKLPVTLDDTWIPDTSEPTISRTVISLSASVSVPAGSYTNCANLRDTDSTEPDLYFDLFLSRGTGAVKYLAHATDLNGTVHMAYDLTNSTIN